MYGTTTVGTEQVSCVLVKGGGWVRQVGKVVGSTAGGVKPTVSIGNVICPIANLIGGVVGPGYDCSIDFSLKTELTCSNVKVGVGLVGFFNVVVPYEDWVTSTAVRACPILQQTPSKDWY